MDIGRLDKRVEWLTIQLLPDENGEPVNTPTLKGRPWANVRYLTGRELLTAGRVITEENATLEMRLNNDIKSSDVIKFDGKTWEIIAISPTDKGFMNITVKVVT